MQTHGVLFKILKLNFVLLFKVLLEIASFDFFGFRRCTPSFMAGIYLHIPFCKQACHYCDFHFSTSLGKRDDIIKALQAELVLQKNYLGNQYIETIYFGGGTPSLLAADEVQLLLDEIATHFHLTEHAEITLEANPDDLNPQKIKELKQTSINRFSIGIQSFFEEDLRWMNRAHNAQDAESSIKRVQDAGFENITIDLIYGYPLLTDEKWEANLQRLVNYQVPHLSSYAMTVEPQTALASFIRKGKQQAMDETKSAAQFVQLINQLELAGFEHYEISNFAQPGRHSCHNSNYWEGIPYLGIGPSAHSFNGETRQWNVANNAHYLEAISNKKIPANIEVLTIANRINEYIMTSLRTSKGMDVEIIMQNFGEHYAQNIICNLAAFISKQWLRVDKGIVTLTTEGKLFADHIAAELFIEK